ncbi:hypothetical protein QTP88_025607 [Uroleucon formosanum]
MKFLVYLGLVKQSALFTRVKALLTSRYKTVALYSITNHIDRQTWLVSVINAAVERDVVQNYKITRDTAPSDLSSESSFDDTDEDPNWNNEDDNSSSEDESSASPVMRGDGNEWNNVIDEQPYSNVIFNPNNECVGINGDIVETMVDCSPYDFFALFFDDEVLKLIVVETNRYANDKKKSNLSRNVRIKMWKETDVKEIKTFFGLIIWMGMDKMPTIGHYWRNTTLFSSNIPQYMSKNRFELLLTLIPNDSVCIDESMVLFSERLLFRQYNASKRYRYGITIFKLCTTDFYTSKYKIYSGKEVSDNTSVATKVAFELLSDYLDFRRTLYADNWYNSIDLDEKLLDRNTHLVGTIRTNRKQIPKEIVTTKLKKRIETCLSEAYKISIEKHNETIKNNRYVVSRLIDATCYLAKQELPFRGHDEQITSTNRGNYVELINLMGTLDLKLSGHLSTATVFSGLSGDIQNDLIQSISNVLMKRVTLEIKNVDFVSIIMDETTDVVSKSQLSIIFRYITHGVQERFLGFVDVSQD